EQLVSLKKENLKASDYASRTISELFPKEILDKSIVKQVTTSASVIAINDGDGNFTIQQLPPRAQLSCICDITCTDVNNDGHLDLVMAGNNFEFKPQFSRLDASYGNLLLGDGKLGYEWLNYDESGFKIKEEVKYLKQLKDAQGRRYLVAAINNEKPKIFAINE
ncbi:MAG: CRTAC1 family protein, partial [Allomuricauda sp.]